MVATLERKVGGAIALDEDGPGSFEGRASTFGSLDSYHDVVAPGAYRATLPDFIQHGFIAAHHDWHAPIAYVLDAEERQDGLWVRARFHSDEESQKHRTRARERLAAGRSVGLSIGFRADDYYQREEDGARVLTAITLYEVSLVSRPAEPLARVSVVKHPPDPMRQELAGIFASVVRGELADLQHQHDELQAIKDLCEANELAIARRR